MKMGLMYTWLLLLMFCSAWSYWFRSGAPRGLFVQNPDLEWARMETKISKEMMPLSAPKGKLWRSASSSTTPATKVFNQYMIMSASKDPKKVFKPGQGDGPLPASVMNLLLGSPSNFLPIESVKDPKQLVQMLCHVDRLYVRINRVVFKTSGAYKYLKLGTCPVNAGTQTYYYLLYLLTTDCGFTQQSKADYVYISNVLTYEPTTPVLREMPFTIPLLCKYPRSFYSYEAGFYPNLQSGKVFKALGQQGGLTLTPQDVKGDEITNAQTYAMGAPIYFEAKQSEKTGESGDQRIYINKCFMTASPNPNSSPKYAVIDNQGCMIDGKMSNDSRFLTGASKTKQKVSVGAFIFPDVASSSTSSQKLFMHCEITTGQLNPTPSSKACNYNLTTKTWQELYGGSSVCNCCNFTCPSAQPMTLKKMISSPSWNVDLSGRDGYVGVNPQMRPFETDASSLEDSYWAERKDFPANREYDYEKKSRGNYFK